MEGGPFRIRRLHWDPRKSYAPPLDRVNRETAPQECGRFLRAFRSLHFRERCSRLHGAQGFSPLSSRQPPDRGRDRMSTLSVVIVTQDRREELRRLLSDLTAMAEAAGDEVVVVDNGSADGTVEMVRENFTAASVLVHPVNRGAPAARNAAARTARGEILVFLDDDTRVEDPRFLERVRKLFETEREAAVVAFRILDPATRKPRRFEIPHRRKDRFEEPCETSTFISAGCAVRRNV